MGAHDESTNSGGHPESLSRILEHGERVKALLEECAAELLSLNSAVREVLAQDPALPAFEVALDKSAALVGKVQVACAEVSLVNGALALEVRDRSMVDLRFAAAVEQEQASRHAALHDVLTGLPNRALFNDRLDHGLAQARRHDWTLAVMFVDLNDFKIINDTHGHEAGDGVLRAIAQRLKANTRGADTVSRHGGDEFLYLLTGIRDVANIAKIAEKIVLAVQAPCIVSLREGTISASVKASIGISTFPKDGTTADELIKGADEAMYRAKQAKSGVAFAS